MSLYAKTVTKCYSFGMPGRVYEALFEVATDQYGYVTAEDARSLGIEPQRLRALASRGDLRRVSHGLYRFDAVPVTMHDQLMEATLWPRRLGVISHDTALDLWDLCDISPAKVHVTVPRRARVRRDVSAAYAVHIRDLDASDFTRREGIPVVTVVRAILDGMEAIISPHLITQALDSAERRGLLSGQVLVDLHARHEAIEGA